MTIEFDVNYYFVKKEFPFKELFSSNDVTLFLKEKERFLTGDSVFVDPSTHVKEGVVIEGPVWIGKNCVIGPHAYIRKGTIIGDNCEIGRAEIKNSILLDGVKAHHHCYIGDSIIGNHVNVGAGVILSNFKFEGAEIKVDGKSLGRKFGAVIGDNVNIGCNAVLAPGTFVGANVWIYPSALLGALFLITQ